MSNINNKEAELRQEIEKIDCEIAGLEKSIGIVQQTCGTTDSRGIISVSRFLESIPVMQKRIEKLVQMKKEFIATLNEILGSQKTAVEAQCE
jgi:prefoldin subunit 5